MAQPNPHSYTGPRQLAQPGRNLFLDRSEKGPHAQRFLISAGTRTAPACLSVPLRAVGISLQLDLHPARSPCSSGQDRRQTAGSRSLTEYVTVIPNVSTKSFKNILFRRKGYGAKKRRKSAEYKIFSPLLCQLSYLESEQAGRPGF